jgi:XTP/dITP diphosphohydrolase
MTELLLASNNDHKHAEFVRLFPGVRIVRPREIGVDFEFAEDGASFLANALGKARALYEIAHRAVIGDDSGLCVAALGGAPGVRSSRYGSDGTRKLETPEQNEPIPQFSSSTEGALRKGCFSQLIFTSVIRAG